MKLRLSAFAALLAASLTLTGSALAFDCIRVSSSLQGLQQSTANSGNWLLWDMTNPTVIEQSLYQLIGKDVGLHAATCVSTNYLATGLPPYFALGFGVAGGNTNGPGVIAHNNPNDSVFANLKGIDHLDASPIGQALQNAFDYAKANCV